MTPLLLALVLVPLLGACLVAMMPSREPGVTKALTLALATVELGLGWSVLAGFDPDAAGPQMAELYPWIEPFGPHVHLAVDGLSLWTLALVVVVVPLALLGGWDHVRDQGRELGVPLLLLQAGAVAVLLAQDVGLMLAGWELAAFAGWALSLPLAEPAQRRWADRWLIGTQLGAGLWGAAAMLAAIAHYNANPGEWSLRLSDLSQVMLPADQQQLAFAGVALAAVSMLPVFPVHAWVPALARARNPVAAAVLCALPIELGRHLLDRVGLELFPLGAVDLAPILAALALAGIVHAALALRVERSLGRMVGYVVLALACVEMVGVLGMHGDGRLAAAYLGVLRGLGVLGLVIVVAAITRVRGTDLLDGPESPGGSWLILALVAPGLGVLAGLSTLAAGGVDEAAVGLPDATFVSLAAVIGMTCVGAIMLGRVSERVGHGLRGGMGQGGQAGLPARESTVLALVLALELAAGAFALEMFVRATWTARERAALTREHVCVGEAARALTRAERYDALAVTCAEESR